MIKTARTRGLPLQVRWTAALLAIGALPLGALAWNSVRIQRDGLQVVEQTLEAVSIDRAAEAIRQDLDDAAAATHRVGRLLTEARIANEDARLALAREGVAGAPRLAHVAVYGAGGELIDTITRVEEAPTPPAPPAPPAPPRIAADLLANPPHDGAWLPPEWVPQGVALRYVEPMERDGRRLAWVVGTLGPAVLATRLRSISAAHFVRDDTIVLLDRDLRVLAGDPALAVGSSLAGRDIFARASPPLADHAYMETDEFDGPAGPMMGTLRVLPGRGWIVVARRPARAAYNVIDDSRRRFIGAAVAVALAAVALGAWLAARTTRPVRALVELTRAYGRREFAARSRVRTGDELETLGSSLEEMADQLVAGEAEVARRARVEADLSRYMPGELARAIAAGEASLALGGERRAVTVVFADVVAFTPFAEGAAPERVVAFLNELFTVLTEVVFRHGGTVDKFLGDCVMAVFGAPTAQADHTARALAAAEDMHRFVEASAPAWQKKYGIEARMGIGVNAGEVLVGNLGSEARMEYTVIGDAVNVAARLEALARPGQTLVTATVAADASALAAGGFAFRSLGTHPLRGKKEPVEILEVCA